MVNDEPMVDGGEFSLIVVGGQKFVDTETGAQSFSLCPWLGHVVQVVPGILGMQCPSFGVWRGVSSLGVHKGKLVLSPLEYKIHRPDGSCTTSPGVPSSGYSKKIHKLPVSYWHFRVAVDFILRSLERFGSAGKLSWGTPRWVPSTRAYKRVAQPMCRPAHLSSWGVLRGAYFVMRQRHPWKSENALE